jgi:hypothetical protein
LRHHFNKKNMSSGMGVFKTVVSAIPTAAAARVCCIFGSPDTRQYTYARPFQLGIGSSSRIRRRRSKKCPLPPPWARAWIPPPSTSCRARSPLTTWHRSSARSTRTTRCGSCRFVAVHSAYSSFCMRALHPLLGSNWCLHVGHASVAHS